MEKQIKIDFYGVEYRLLESIGDRSKIIGNDESVILIYEEAFPLTLEDIDKLISEFKNNNTHDWGKSYWSPHLDFFRQVRDRLTFYNRKKNIKKILES